MTLRQARVLADCSQADVAYFMGCGKHTVARWEHGYPPRINELLRLCEIYRISITDLDLEEWKP